MDRLNGRTQRLAKQNTGANNQHAKEFPKHGDPHLKVAILTTFR